MTYSYKCVKCSNVKTLNLRMTEVSNAMVICEKCQNHMVRVWDVPGIKFIGKGFHCNDNRKS